MLRSFRFANHRSMLEEQELVLIPSYDRGRAALPVAGVFGANASGKSSVLDALVWMRRAVLESFAVWQPGSGVPRVPFRLGDSGARASSYAVEIQLDGVRYYYGFEVDDELVHAEWLYAYPHGRRRVVFERDGDAVRIGSTVPDARSREETLAGLTRGNALLLSVAAHSNQREALPIYEWFRGCVRLPDQTRASVIADLVERVSATPEARDATLALIRYADLGIHDVQMIHGIGEPTVRFVHRGGDTPLEFLDESAGTRTWLAMLTATLDVLDRGGLLVVDELDRSLHPHLSAGLVTLFREPDVNRHHAQLLFTAHDVTLLDEDTLRRDEIWFVEKDFESGATRLFALTDFHPRKNENTARRYLAGSYGAVPFISDVAVVNTLSGRNDAA